MYLYPVCKPVLSLFYEPEVSGKILKNEQNDVAQHIYNFSGSLVAFLVFSKPLVWLSNEKWQACSRAHIDPANRRWKDTSIPVQFRVCKGKRTSHCRMTHNTARVAEEHFLAMHTSCSPLFWSLMYLFFISGSAFWRDLCNEWRCCFYEHTPQRVTVRSVLWAIARIIFRNTCSTTNIR